MEGLYKKIFFLNLKVNNEAASIINDLLNQINIEKCVNLEIRRKIKQNASTIF